MKFRLLFLLLFTTSGTFAWEPAQGGKNVQFLSYGMWHIIVNNSNEDLTINYLYSPEVRTQHIRNIPAFGGWCYIGCRSQVKYVHNQDGKNIMRGWKYAEESDIPQACLNALPLKCCIIL